ncbi:hypothetical protein MycrhN_4898 [Mycolicibacterium rhodesiae NBB3]|uniref:Uncharacterized protein n=1 Tax=Mycolicibacterium rhodesiae (strain NBB3) TaxID=710685 RepID=G8RTK5_MYCRN|nr:hypothetical protein MycrhN_4898 [Mycolicibacterium rhodesiae NBB3]
MQTTQQYLLNQDLRVSADPRGGAVADEHIAGYGRDAGKPGIRRTT